MEQVAAFREESDILLSLLQTIDEADWSLKTQFKSWTVNDVIVHLHFWNRAVDLSRTDQAAFHELASNIMENMGQAGLRPIENAALALRGKELMDEWCETFRNISDEWGDIDPKTRLKWIGPDMSARSAITARQMETWAHGQEIFDLLGVERQESDRIKNIVILGINTFGWSFKVQGLKQPAVMPHVELVAPSGALWHFGDKMNIDVAGEIHGSAVDFARVVTQTRNIRDTVLDVRGEVANLWMNNAQCFAGGKETPPAAGERFRQKI